MPITRQPIRAIGVGMWAKKAPWSGSGRRHRSTGLGEGAPDHADGCWDEKEEGVFGHTG